MVVLFVMETVNVLMELVIVLLKELFYLLVKSHRLLLQNVKIFQTQQLIANHVFFKLELLD